SNRERERTAPAQRSGRSADDQGRSDSATLRRKSPRRSAAMASTVEDEMVNLVNLNWRLHGDGKTIAPGEVVAPDERLSWPRSIGIGAQHVLAMFGATFLVPLLTGFPPTTTLFFSGIGTLVFLVITGNRLPSYLGSSFAFIAPVLAATASHGASSALGGLIIVGALFAIVGVIVMTSGTRWIEWL